MMAAYYNEFDPFAAQWLRNLIAAGHIPPGDVDDRSITEVAADDLRPYAQCHFFAGIGLWSLALRWAGWPDDRPVWTGSCPCQPFSGAGRQEGYSDARHLAPVWLDLIAERHPPTILGEQVAAKAGRAWLAALRAELEDLGYAVGAADLCAAGVGAPHIRQRLWFGAVRMGDGEQPGPEGHAGDGDGAPGRPVESGPAPEAGGDGGLADADGAGPQPRGEAPEAAGHRNTALANGGADRRAIPPHDDWRDADWLFCRDGKWRPVEPGTFPLVDGDSGRVGKLRAYGNAICPEIAAEFIGAFMASRNEIKPRSRGRGA